MSEKGCILLLINILRMGKDFIPLFFPCPFIPGYFNLLSCERTNPCRHFGFLVGGNISPGLPAPQCLARRGLKLKPWKSGC
jgi:hypothetical protein